MGVPSTRTPVRVARGTYANLTTTNALAALEEGEIAYATDSNTAYVVETESGTKALRAITGISSSDLIDEDNMASDSATKVPSQQSVKAYVDAGDLSLIDEDNMSTDSATRPPSQQSVKAYVDTQVATKQASDAELTELATMTSGTAGALADLTQTEVEILDGATVTTAELNTLDGFTGDKDDLIYAKDLKATGVTATEFDYLDGVTSSIQTQLNAKGVGDAVLANDQNWTGAQRGAITALTSAASITIDFGASNNFSLTTGHAAIAFANPTTEVAGQSGSIFITQGSTTCAAPTWGDQYLFAGGTAPALTGTTGKIARIDYIVQEAGKIHCVATDNLAGT